MKFFLAILAGSVSCRPLLMDNLPPPNLQGPRWAASYPGPRFVTQWQDHFNQSNQETWQQAYYVNDTFWVPGHSAPVFLCVGGEGPPIDGSAVVDSVHCNIAVEWLRETKALMFALEHRYYGCHNMSACPVKGFESPTALKYLSSRQAVEDIANFVRQMNSVHALSRHNRWVTWGGSYPGMLAGFSRLKHPELIHAAVASSAPVHAKFDMAEYNDAVANAYMVDDNHVGGSEMCSKTIREGHRRVEEMLQHEGGPTAIEKLLGLPNGTLKTRAAQASYLGNGLAYFPAQGNDPACEDPLCNIAKICKHMLNATLGDELQRLLELRKQQQRWSQAALISEPDYWYYQTCTEFGFYQSCDEGSSCMYVRGLVSAVSEAEGCAEYNITAEDVKKNIEDTNSHYGGLAPTGPSGGLGSCVIWPNGEVDPWATLSILTAPGDMQPTLWVPGASHHAWTHPSAPTDQESVVVARSSIRRAVQGFLQISCEIEASLVV